jgi:hypothetical protein
VRESVGRTLELAPSDLPETIDAPQKLGWRNSAPRKAVVTENSVRAENAVVPSIREILVVSR